MLNALLDGARPDLDTLISHFGSRFSDLHLFRGTPQDPEWHAEGDVHTHTQMVLDELYRSLDSPDGKALSGEVQRELILGAMLHDLSKPHTTRTMQIRGVERIGAPQHEAKGRSAVAVGLMGIGLPWRSVWHIMGMVGSHHEPKLLVVKDRSPGEYRRISRRVDPMRVAWLERADMRGRTCPDRDHQIETIDLFQLGAEEYAPTGWNDRWRTHFAERLADRPAAFQDWVFGQAIRAFESDQIATPEEADFLTYQEPHPPELVVFSGPSGSGKSTFVQNYLQKPEHFHQVVSMDEIREALAGDRSDQALNGAVRQAARNQLKAALRPGKRVVWDATGLRRDFRSIVIDTGFSYGALVTLVVFQQSVEEYRRGNQRRAHPVPPSVLNAQLESWEWPEVDEAHRVLVVNGKGEVQGAFGLCGDVLPWGLRWALP